MARLQILQLPEAASDERPPFALIVDQATEMTMRALGNGGTRTAAGMIGARAVLLFEDTIEIPANDLLPPAEPLTLISSTEDSGGHAFDIPGYQDPQRCARCLIDRVSWRTGSDQRSCEQVRADNESGHRFLPMDGGVLTCRRCGMTRVDWVTRRDAPKCDAVSQREAG